MGSGSIYVTASRVPSPTLNRAATTTDATVTRANNRDGRVETVPIGRIRAETAVTGRFDPHRFV